jgi:nucleosome binding factor SPN SPT16 subunit
LAEIGGAVTGRKQMAAAYPPVLEAGGHFAFTGGSAQSAADADIALPASRDVVVCAVGVRYAYVCVNICRTLLFAPDRGQRVTWMFLQQMRAVWAEIYCISKHH